LHIALGGGWQVVVSGHAHLEQLTKIGALTQKGREPAGDYLICLCGSRRSTGGLWQQLVIVPK
jgi:hypothetical protein